MKGNFVCFFTVVIFSRKLNTMYCARKPCVFITLSLLDCNEIAKPLRLHNYSQNANLYHFAQS